MNHRVWTRARMLTPNDKVAGGRSPAQIAQDVYWAGTGDCATQWREWWSSARVVGDTCAVQLHEVNVADMTPEHLGRAGKRSHPVIQYPRLGDE